MSKSLDDIHALLEKHLSYNTAPDAAQHKAVTLAAHGRQIAGADANKTPDALLAELHAEANDDQTRSKAMTVALTTAKFASLLSVLSVQSDIQTRRIVRLTVALLVLTFLLLIFTVYLSYDAYEKNKHHKATELNDTKPK